MHDSDDRHIATPLGFATPLDFKVYGLDCAEEAKQIKHALRGIAEEEHLYFDFLSGRLRVDARAAACTADAVRAAIATTGMRAAPWAEHLSQAAAPVPFLERHARALYATTSGAAIVLATLIDLLSGRQFPGGLERFFTPHPSPLPVTLLYALAITAGLLPLLPKAWVSLRHVRPDIHLLVVVAAVGAVILGDYSEAAMVVFLFALSLWLETFSVGRARNAVTALMALTPPSARYRCPCDGDILEKPVAEVPLGATVLLRPGERAPLDGTILLGESQVDQSAITGEARLIAKAPGDTLYAGSINQEGALEFRADKRSGDTQLARILHLVEEARAKRAPAEQWVERFARWYTPIVMLLALAIGLLGPLAGKTWPESAYAALVLLLIACPCALVISTPVTVFAGLASAARRGVLIKGGNFLEAPATLRAFAFDKTGTLTLGKPTVQQILPAPGHTEAEVLAIAAGLATESQHVHAHAIRQFAAAQGVPPAAISANKMHPGEGVSGSLDTASAWMGNHRLLAARTSATSDSSPPSINPIQPLTAIPTDAAHSIVYVGQDASPLGYLLLADALRPEAPAALAALRDLGLRETILLTGDNTATARAIAEAAGIATWRAELLPEEKVNAIQELLAKHGAVGMIGDGVNDAPALAAATVGIALAAVGTDAAIETADIAFMSDDLTLLPWLIAHSRRTLRTIKQNIALALTLKGAVLLLALTGHAALWLAITADMGATLLVIGNGLRLLRVKR